MRAVLLLFCLPLACCGPPRACLDEASAYAALQSIVRAELAAPASARFPQLSAVKVTPVNDCEFLAAGFVDSRNAAGREVRSIYRAHIRFDRSTGRYERQSLTFGLF